MFEAALEASPADAEIASALGVLFNLSRDYDRAVNAFRHALEVQRLFYVPDTAASRRGVA